MKHYDYIFTGSGLAALMTVYKMARSGKFKESSILLLDEPNTKGEKCEENPKKTNDRTWCFWQKQVGNWEQSVSKRWDSALFANADFKRDLDLQPYQYNMIQGLDFYNQVFEFILNEKNISYVNQKVTDINELKEHVFVATETDSYTCDTVFNSIYNKAEVKNQSKYPVLQQHFIGWFIKSKEAVFNPDQATFMDFSVEQKGNTRFMYVLPTSTNEALLEYTLFSHLLLPKEEYEQEIENYIRELGITDFEIIEKEQGSIPMTCYPFWKKTTKRVLNIGTAGGWTKASTGYTFKKADKRSTQLVAFLQEEKDLRQFHKKSKFWFYDLLLLDILDRNNELGASIFSAMFEKGNPSVIFKFLDEETTYFEDLQVILKCPKLLFIKALARSYRYI
ncbi:lycopene cyclase [Flavobacterium sp. XN-5]|uniref:lycopene cyclase family protein n=1 Tax=Flavobacterium sp. XN-5 TaxID=2599390 RepID=UPI0011CB86CA|nr:lycopene cyclase family protein [Flavobacterium sp. XN-5]NGY36774.1 lycopene cyclase [Flavobacterium sp. XN-5]